MGSLPPAIHTPCARPRPCPGSPGRDWPAGVSISRAPCLWGSSSSQPPRWAGRPRDLLASLEPPCPGSWSRPAALSPRRPRLPHRPQPQGWLLLRPWAATSSGQQTGSSTGTASPATAPECLQRERRQARCLECGAEPVPPTPCCAARGALRGWQPSWKTPSSSPRPSLPRPPPRQGGRHTRGVAHVQPHRRRQIGLQIIQGCRGKFLQIFQCHLILTLLCLRMLGSGVPG